LLLDFYQEYQMGKWLSIKFFTKKEALLLLFD